MTECEYKRKLDEIDRLLNDPEVSLDPAKVWNLLAEIAPYSALLADTSGGSASRAGHRVPAPHHGLRHCHSRDQQAGLRGVCCPPS